MANYTMNYKQLFASPEFQMLDGSRVTEASVRINAAMQSGKTLDELTLADYEARKQQWIRLLVMLMHNPVYADKKKQLLCMLRELNFIINGRPAWDAGLDEEDEETGSKTSKKKERLQPVFRPSQRYYDYVHRFGNRLFLGVLTDFLNADEKMLLSQRWRRLTDDPTVAQWLLKHVGLMAEANDSRMITLAAHVFRYEKSLSYVNRKFLIAWLHDDIAARYSKHSIETIAAKPLPEPVMQVFLSHQ